MAIYSLYKIVIHQLPIHQHQFWALPPLLLFIALPNDSCIVQVNWLIALYLLDAHSSKFGLLTGLLNFDLDFMQYEAALASVETI